MLQYWAVIERETNSENSYIFDVLNFDKLFKEHDCDPESETL